MLQSYNEKKKYIQVTCLLETVLQKYHLLKILNCISEKRSKAWQY